MTAKTRKQQLEELLADDPNDPFLRYGLAMEYVREGNDAQAMHCFWDLLATSPDYVPAYHQAGLALLRLGKPDEARQVLQQGIAVAGRQGDAHAAQEMQDLLQTSAPSGEC